jgi:hypothetical protein
MPPWSESPGATRPLYGVALVGGVLQLPFTFVSPPPPLSGSNASSQQTQTGQFLHLGVWEDSTRCCWIWTPQRKPTSHPAVSDKISCGIQKSKTHPAFTYCGFHTSQACQPDGPRNTAFFRSPHKTKACFYGPYVRRDASMSLRNLGRAVDHALGFLENLGTPRIW